MHELVADMRADPEKCVYLRFRQQCIEQLSRLCEIGFLVVEQVHGNNHTEQEIFQPVEHRDSRACHDAEEIRAAAASAQADGFIESFTDGYETEIEQGGSNVSGGQKQRLCIARALLKKPKILILDDSTSAVDTATEAKIRYAFSHELKDTTKIIIAQRISSVMDADMIVVMNDGRITGVGTHNELREKNQEYREIYESQSKTDKEGA